MENQNMAKELIKKNSSLQRGTDIKPKEIFDRNSIYTVTEDATPEAKVIPKRIKTSEKTTTIRCSAMTSNRLNAIVTSFGMDSVNELLETLLDNYEASLTTDERRELKTLIEVYNRKNKK